MQVQYGSLPHLYNNMARSCTYIITWIAPAPDTPLLEQLHRRTLSGSFRLALSPPPRRISWGNCQQEVFRLRQQLGEVFFGISYHLTNLSHRISSETDNWIFSLLIALAARDKQANPAAHHRTLLYIAIGLARELIHVLPYHVGLTLALSFGIWLIVV